MSNDYFDNTTPIGKNTKARSADVNAKMDAIAAGFAKLPGKTSLEQGKTTYAASGGTADAYTAAMPTALTAYAVGQHFRILIPAGETNTGASTLNVDGLGARAIKRVDGTDVEAGDLTAGDIVDLVYNGTSMVMLGTYRSHLAGMAANLGADLVFSGNPSFTGSPDFSEAGNKATIRQDLGLKIGTNVQAYNAKLQSLSGLSGAANRLPYLSGASAFALTTLTSFGRSLIDDADASAARSTLGLGDASTATVQSSATDTTSGRLMTVEAFGLGVEGSLLPPSNDMSDPLPTGFYNTDASTTGTGSETAANGSFIHVQRGTGLGSPGALQIWQRGGGALRYRLFNSGTPTDWEEFITSEGGQTINGDLHVKTGDSGVTIPNTSADELVVEGAARAGISILSPDANDSNIFFGSPSKQVGARVSWDFSGLEFRVGPNETGGETVFTYGDNSEGMRLDGEGNLGLGIATPSYKLQVRETDTETAAAVFATHASFASSNLLLNANRAANSDYNFLRAYSGNLGDKEFQLSGDGNGTCDGSWTGGGADYAEYFEWLDGNPNSDTRTGLSVVLDGDKIRLAQVGETPIGVISANPSVVGDGDIDRWKGKYLRDDFGAYVKEDYEAISWTETVIETETVQEQATEAQERTREVIEVVNGRAVKRTITETVQVQLFDEFPLVDEAGNPVMQQVQVGMTDPVLDEGGDEVVPAQPIFEDRQAVYRAPRMVDATKETAKEVPHSYAADEVPEGVTVPSDAHRATQQRRKLNPAYDPAQEYTPRADRPEWDLVGLMGKLRLRKGQPVSPGWIKMRDVSETVEEWLV